MARLLARHAALAAPLLLALAIAVASWTVFKQAGQSELVTHTLAVKNRLTLILSMLQDAEVGQRGYLLTSDALYLEPYRTAIARLPAELDALDQATADNARQSGSIAAIRPLIAMKLSELSQTIALRGAGDAAGAMQVVRASTGKITMDGLREALGRMQGEEEVLLVSREQGMARTTMLLQLVLVGVALLGLAFAISAVRVAMRRASQAEADRDVLASRLDRRLVAIMAADIAGFSQHMENDEAQTLAALTAHRRIAERIIPAAGGRIAGTAGDSLIAEFASVTAAVDSAVTIQREIAQANAKRPPERRLDLRIGINVGDVMVQDGDIFGDSVNIAARLEGLAEPGSVFVSRAVRDHLRKIEGYGFDDLGFMKAKNIARPLRVFRAHRNELAA